MPFPRSLRSSLYLIGIFLCPGVLQVARASQADDTTITITAKTPGATPFINQLSLTASDTNVLSSIQFTITPKPGSVTRPLSGTYSNAYLLSRGYLLPATGEVFLPVYGLYAGYTNTVTLAYFFLDGSSKQATTTITTATFDDPCGYDNPTVLQARSTGTTLSYDYILISDTCNDEFSPAIIDTDSALRWVGPAGFSSITSGFFDSAIYMTYDKRLFRIELDGALTLLHDFSDIGITYFYHNIDVGKSGIILEANTADYVEAMNIEVDLSGNVLKIWNLADIISQTMIAGGDDPSTLVYPAPLDWFHNNAAAYNPADNSVIISSRQNFLVCLDYDTGAIKWILGDPTKEWYQFPSLQQYALTLTDGSLPPIGQHAISFTYDQNILVMDNGQQSSPLLIPQGTQRGWASPRKYRLDLAAKTATELWSYSLDETIFSPLCGSVYEDAPLNYLVEHSVVNGYYAEDAAAQLIGLDASNEQIFYYQYPTVGCAIAYNSRPLHLEGTKFPSIGPIALNLSTRGTVASDDTTLIAGFIVTGTDPKRVALRVLGPSLGDLGVQGAVADPNLLLYDSSGNIIASNDDWATDPAAAELSARALAPNYPAEAATIQTLTPAAYTMVARGNAAEPGVGLVEAYDLLPEAASHLANISTRGYVGEGDDVLISGFIVGDAGKATVVIRALGPSLDSTITDPLGDPTLTIYDSNGVGVATNDDWQDDQSVAELQQLGLAPKDSAESATIAHLLAGAYSAVVSGSDNTVGIGLVEVYDLD